ncbi:MAG: dipeptidyl aminopeptidase/acylaminoacyl peptidase [Chlamydiales bacterium]|jgi:dipeptidyl aminopeptidase/acylaminoacyl peptidase
MADPDWIGREPERAYWADDSSAILFERKREGERIRDLYRIELSTGEVLPVADAERGSVSVRGGDWSPDRRHKVFARSGDLFVLDLESGAERQLTRTVARERAPAFVGDGTRIRFDRDGETYLRELTSGLEFQPAELRFEDDPFEEEDDDEDVDYLEGQQERLFEIVRLRAQRKERDRNRSRELQNADPTRSPLPWYLDKGSEAVATYLAPDGRTLLAVVSKESKGDGKRDLMPVWVTESSWVETREMRAHVGYADDRPQTLLLLDLESRERREFDLSALPGISDDPLAFLDEDEEPDEEEQDGDEETSEDEPTPRDITSHILRWAPDGSEFACFLFSPDNKDRWLVRVEAATGELTPVHHVHDEAWVGWRFHELGWLRDGSGLWFTSEESGFSQLYMHDPQTGTTESLATTDEARFEIASVEEAPDGSALYFRANVDHPGVHEICRFVLPDGPFERVTHLGGQTRGQLSPDGLKLLLVHSKALTPPELWVQEATPGATAQRLTLSTTERFRERVQTVITPPTFVEIPSRHGAPLHARLYLPAEEGSAPRPAVAFVHGAGYLQNAHKGWSGYFREFLFHSLLVQEGYVVIDVDYRASAGYGRDWRTAIYRQMGTPELEDYEDAVAWLVANHHVDAERIGVYGGSYGGFMALMALFKQPELFACGAALRPVTDWAHYNHGYTSNILNTPERDPEAYERSSPIEFAEGLNKPLLMCHGMLDDNVLAKDSIRLAQHLIELEKENWELALFPIEAHGFREPSSWLNEYRRIFALFERWLK